MTNEKTRANITRENLQAYFEGKLSEDQEVAVEEYLAECSEEEIAEARQTYAFTSAWNSWTPKAHGEAYRLVQDEKQNRLVHILTGFISLYPQWRNRLQRWLDLSAGQAEAAVRVVMEASGEASRLVTEGLEAMTRPQGRWQFSLEEAIVPTLGDTPKRSAPPLAAIALHAGKHQARVSLSGPGEVSVRVDEQLPGQVRPLVLLVPEEGQAEPQVKELETGPDGVYLIARFENVAPGQYLTLFEPV